MIHFLKRSGPRASLRVLLSVLTAAVLFIWIPKSAGGSESRDNRPELLALISSDLHYSRDGIANDLIVPGMAYADEITDAIIAEVTDLHPKVFILTGDNTNSGKKEDMELLFSKLKKVKDADIKLIMTTGNHDFNHSDPAGYEACFFPLLEPSDRDPDSLSYTVVLDDIVFLAMDDNAVTPGGAGKFSDATLGWLEDICSKYESKRIIFLSHHNILPGKGEESSSSYRIQNDELPDILKKHGVQLCFTGHLHSQMILNDGSLYEVVSSMPFNGSHLIDFLEDSEDGLSYHAKPIDFSRYGSEGLFEKLKASEEKQLNNFKGSLLQMLAESEYSRQQKEEITELFLDFMSAYSSGSIAMKAGEIKENPYYQDMLDFFWDKNYGPWMAGTVENTDLDATRLILK